MKRTTCLLAVLLILSVLLSGCGFGAPRTPSEVTIAMGFIPNVQFAPMYVAIERGYFREEGLDVALDYGMETDLLQRLGANELQFVVGSGDQAILARANELPIKYVVNWYRRFPVCVVSLAEAGIDTPADLVGKTVGTPVLAGASYIGWLAFLQQVGIAPEQVNLQVIGYTQVASLTEKRVDAAICYAMNEPVQMAAAGLQTNVFYLDEYTRLISNGLMTNDNTIKQHPELVQGVVRAFMHGLQDTIADPEAAFAITRRAIPEMDDQTATLQRQVLQECVTFWSGEALGASVPEDWETSVRFMEQLGLIAPGLKAADVYTNRFVSP